MDDDAKDVDYATTTPCDELGCQRDGVQEGRKATPLGGAHRNAGGHKGWDAYKTRLTMDDDDEDVDDTTTHAHRSTPRPTNVRGDSRGISRWTNAVDENKTRVFVGRYPGRPPSYGSGRVPKKHRRLQGHACPRGRVSRLTSMTRTLITRQRCITLLTNDSCDVKGTTAAGMAQQRL